MNEYVVDAQRVRMGRDVRIGERTRIARDIHDDLGAGLAQIGLLAGIYPGVWGMTQLLTGALPDRIGRKGMIVGGMVLQGIAIGLLPLLHGL